MTIQRRRRSSSAPTRSLLKTWLVATLVLSATGAAGLATGVGFMVWHIPPVETLLAARPSGVTTIYDRRGRVVASLQNGENREIVPLDDIAVPMQQAVIASEDIRFYEHFGIDPRGIARALFSRGERGGGSTLTQQLAKNLFLSADRTLSRKVADMWLALQLERTLSKRQILEMYLNQVYFGHGAWGVEAAAKKYFGKKARELEAGEAALLAGLLPAPEYYSPYRNPKSIKGLQGIVLQRMVDAGFLSPAEAAEAASRKLNFANTPDYAYRAPYFTSQVLKQLTEKFGRDLVERGALRIHTTMDLTLQEEAEAIIRSGVARYAGFRVKQGALVAVEPGTGAIRALVGGTSYDASQFNRAVQALRQPGSTFKPFVYLTAFSKGYLPGSTVEDSPANFGGYRPQNYDHRFRGTVTFAQALAFSYNVPAVRVADMVGIQEVINTARLAGITSNMPPELSVALGSAEVTPLELAGAYATLGANGAYAEPHLIDRVEDQSGQLIEQTQARGTSVFADTAVAALHRCLSGVINFGTGAAAQFGRPAAGKTGTTSENRDTWFAGYTPDMACVVWLGNDDNSRLGGKATGGQLAAPLWSRFMRAAHRGLPVRGLPGANDPALDPNASATLDPQASLSLPTEPAPVAPPSASGPPLQPALEGSPLAEPLPETEWSTPEPLPPSPPQPEPTAVETVVPPAPATPEASAP
ncbi:MAG: PBP1A family penicillin-binding protein [Candidatus Sericytochromatia bacterium]|nr:PBP1A family penicillin-binding protein [Candidatus Sericytochromatia bacterium]